MIWTGLTWFTLLQTLLPRDILSKLYITEPPNASILWEFFSYRLCYFLLQLVIGMRDSRIPFWLHFEVNHPLPKFLFYDKPSLACVSEIFRPLDFFLKSASIPSGYALWLLFEVNLNFLLSSLSDFILKSIARPPEFSHSWFFLRLADFFLKSTSYCFCLLSSTSLWSQL